MAEFHGGFDVGNGGDEIETFEIMIHRLYCVNVASPSIFSKRPKLCNK